MKRSAAPIPAALAAASMAAVLAVGCGPTVGGGDGNLLNGKKLFVSKCGACHVLSRAGTKGNTGPNLDDSFTAALKDGFPRSTYEGVVHRQILYPDTQGAMPANLVTGQDARDVAAYVAYAAGKTGADAGALANAVAGANQKVAVEKGGKIEIDADPNGQLLYLASGATGTPGSVTITSLNKSAVPHNIALEGNGVSAKGPIISGGKTSSITVVLKVGKYTFFCSVPGHRQAGMVGTLTVK